jgi:ABC-2 type transport system ATP-binding protein
MSSAIRVESLNVQYRTKKGEVLTAVQDLSFDVLPGEIVGFLGPNGAGKSSTLKVLMGFVEAKSGRAEIFGETAGTPLSRSKTGYLPEVAMYYPFLTPIETLTMYGELQGLSGKPLKEEIHQLLDLVGLGKAKTKLNRSMSKGMLQRVGIAQSLLGNPQLLILDEVTSGLDPVGRKELRELLKERQKQGTTLFFSSHELAEVDMLCDRILLIHKGKLIEERAITELKDQLRNFRLTYQNAISMVGLSEELSQRSNDLYEARFETKDSLIQAIERVQKGGGKVVDVVSQEGSLEDYFINTVEAAA